MKQKKLLTVWACMFALCAAAGWIPQPTGMLKGLLIALSLGFFIPPSMLIYRAVNRKKTDRDMLRLIRNLSLLSLAGTTVTLLLNFLSVAWSQAVGEALYGVLVIVSSPMICAQYWFLSLFGWACLLMVCLKYLRKQ